MTVEFDSFTSDPAPQVRPKRRAWAVLGASMLVAAAGGVGFGIGRSADDGGAVVPSAAIDSETETETAPPVTAATEPASEPATTDVAVDEVMVEETLGDVAADVMEEESVSEAGAIVASGGGGWTVFGGETMTLLAERSTETGAVLRAHLGEVWDHEFSEYEDFGGPDGWQPPGWCFESGQVRVALGGGESTGTSVIDVGSVSWWTEPFEGRAVSALTMGVADANPYRVVFVQAPPSVTNVSVVFGDGATDSMTPTNGIALLAVPGAGPSPDVEQGWTPPPTDFEVTFEEPEGEPIAVSGDRTGYSDPGFSSLVLAASPALPDPGEQPADPSTDEAAIVELMATIYGADDGGNDARIDDPTGVTEAREQVRDGGFEEAAASAEAIVEELVFTSPTEAWFRYRLETTSGIFAGRFGIAVDVDGEWKITRDTICQDLSLAGGDCGGFVEDIRPR